jgi:glycosyltransferase involved in cell wall biosynthesis
MKVLQVHNFYQNAGGEDQVFAAEHDLLVARGHTVVQYIKHNDAVRGMSGIQVGLKTLWNADTYREVRDLIRREQPDVAHAHNTFPLVSPALYYAAAAEGIPIIQTLHNYRLLCPGGAFFRDGRICQDCIQSPVPYRAVLHRCYRSNRAASAAVAAMLTSHRMLGTWNNKVDKYIALTNFSREKFIEGGLPADKIAIKLNFLARDPEMGAGRGGFALFVGRLSEEKGLTVLFDAWQRLGTGAQLKIAGDGPMRDWVREKASSLPGVEVLGFCDRDRVMRLLRDASLVILPSTFYEHLPMTLIEALGCGTPVVASNLGSMKDSIVDGVNGYHFVPGDAQSLSERLRGLLTTPSKVLEIRKSARASYEESYTAERSYISLMDIYNSVIMHYKRASTSSR